MTDSLRSDSQLLTDWIHHRRDRSFHELVARYSGLVHMAALRQCGEESMAADVSQLTFISLAAKAKSLVSRDSIAGWLHVTAVMHSKNLIRQRNREVVRIQRYRTHMETESEMQTSDHWQRMKPVLDDSLASLSAKDREALLLRFYRSLSVAEVGKSLGIATDAAQKRLSRATERLRLQLTRRGCHTGVSLVAAMAAGLGSDAKAVVPASEEIARHAIATSAGAGGAVVAGVGSLVFGKNTAVALVLAATLAGLGVIAFIRGSGGLPEAAGSHSSLPTRSPEAANAVAVPDARRSGGRNRAAAKYPDLAAKHGESRTNLSIHVAEGVIGLLEEVLAAGALVMDPKFADLVQAPGGALSESLGGLEDALKLSESQRNRLAELFVARQKTRIETGRRTLVRLKADPTPLMRLILAGDAFARNEIGAEEYGMIREDAGTDLAGLMNIFDQRNRVRAVMPETEAILTELKPLLDGRQVEVLESYLLENGPASRQEGRTGDNISNMKPMELEKLDTTVRALRKVTIGLRSMMEGAGSPMEVQPKADDAGRSGGGP